jgi:hypothetical protein
MFKKPPKFCRERVQSIARHWQTARSGKSVLLSLSILEPKDPDSDAGRSILDLTSWGHGELSSSIAFVPLELQDSDQGKRFVFGSQSSGGESEAATSPSDVASDFLKGIGTGQKTCILKLDYLKKLANGLGEPAIMIAKAGDRAEKKKALEAMRKRLLVPSKEDAAPGLCAHQFLEPTTERLLLELKECDEYVHALKERILELGRDKKGKGKSSSNSTSSQDALSFTPEDLQEEIKRAVDEQEELSHLIEALHATFGKYAKK